MTGVIPKLSLVEYLIRMGDADQNYELVDGELAVMGIGTGKQGQIISVLEHYLRQAIQSIGQDWIVEKRMIGIQSPRGSRWDTVRIPDVVVMEKELWIQMEDREALILLNDPPPLLVVEVVGESTQSTDYRAKVSEYAVLDIPEYWIVDPLKHHVTVGILMEGLYELREFSGSDPWVSEIFPELGLIPEQVVGVANL